MKKYILFVITSLVFASCGEKEKENEFSFLQGTWKKATRYDYGDGSVTYTTDDSYIITFDIYNKSYSTEFDPSIEGRIDIKKKPDGIGYSQVGYNTTIEKRESKSYYVALIRCTTNYDTTSSMQVTYEMGKAFKKISDTEILFLDTLTYNMFRYAEVFTGSLIKKSND
jgi:hypothetical protein